MKTASIGFRSKTGRAIAVALTAGASGPEFIGRWEISLHDPKIPATGQPHHEVMELPWAQAQRAVRPIERRIEKIAAAALAALARELKTRGFGLAAVGVTGSPDRSLEKLGNFHIRAHAAEGILFRRVIETAAEKHKLRWRGFSDRDVLQTAAAELGLREEQVTDMLTGVGRAAGRPWRQDERAASAAAWLVLQ
jgi:predicted DsbA family dithiol-disulfide isomerase